jgi:hypothetical protein
LSVPFINIKAQLLWYAQSDTSFYLHSMKKTLLSAIFVLLCAILGFSQSKKELKASLNRDLESYIRATNKFDLDSMLLFLPPAMWEIIPLDSLKSVMRNSLDNEYLRIELGEFKFKKYDKIKKAGNFHFTLVHYDTDMSMFFNADQDSSLVHLMLEMFQAQFGKENVQKINDKQFNVGLKNKTIVAYKDPAASKWYMLEDKRLKNGRKSEAEQEIMEKILPEAVINALK